MIKSDGGLARLFQRAWDRLRLNVYIYPGIVGYRSADFLADYYAWRRSRLTSLQIVFNAIVWCGFQAWLPHRARTVARAWGKDEAWVRFARRLGGERMIDPEDLATFGINNELQARTYMRRMDQVQVFRTIESRETDHVTDLIDKELFQSKCEAGGFPIPAIVAIIEDGELERTAARPIPESIIAKPVRGSGGKGITALEHADENRLARFAASLSHERYVVQERLRPHPELTDIALDALCTVRMITLRNEEGQPELVHATLRFAARKKAFVDNGHAGGLVGPLDIESGRISAGISGWGPGTHYTHPATGALIDGRYLPD